MKMEYKNILPYFSNITQYLTESRKSILLYLVIILLASLNILPFLTLSSVSAETFQSTEQLQFTLNPTISINISGNLTIESLTPGDYKDSNIITVTASSNAVAGYSLTSTVGTSTNTSNELRKGGTDTANIFSNLTANQSTLSNFSDNTWGYSYSLDSGSTWISGSTGDTATGYNGYTYDTSTSTSETITHLSSTTSGSSTIQYKIGAKASATQLAGEYTNAINFIGITNPNPPIIYMQDATLADCGKSMVDRRDYNVYSTALVGEKCWMTTNLNLAGGTQLSNLNTDMPAGYTLPTANGFQENNKLPESSTEGFSNDTMAYLYNSNNQSNDCTGSGCYSYYSWTTATLGSGLSIIGSGDAPYSICPAGWHLPTLTDHRNLMVTLGGSAGIDVYNNNTSPTGAEMFSRLSGSPLHYLRTGLYYGGSFNDGGGYGYYWSATPNASTRAHRLRFYSAGVNAADDGGRRGGFGVRCLHD